MTIRHLKIAPPYLQFFISDPSSDNSPIQGESLKPLSDGQCISVPCRYAEEGETDLTICIDEEVDTQARPQFDDFIPTPSGEVLFADANLAALAIVPVQEMRTRVRIWTDGSQLPDRIIVALNS